MCVLRISVLPLSMICVLRISVLPLSMYLCVEDIGFTSFYVFGICVLRISVLPLSMYLVFVC